MKKRLAAVLLAAMVVFVSGTIGAFADSVGNVSNFKSWASYKSVVLTWTPVKGAQGYDISWKSTDGKIKGSKRISNGKTKRYVVGIAQANLYKNLRFSIVAYKGSVKSKKPATCAGMPVRTMQYKFTFRETRLLKSYTGGNYTQKFNRGYNMIATGYSAGRYQFIYKNRLYYVNRLSTTNVGYQYWSLQTRYNWTEAEQFINRLNIGSGTRYLIWVNTYSQKEYIFKGTRGNWKCIGGPWSVTTGACYTPTSNGLGRIQQKDPSQNGLPYWSVVSDFSIHGKHASWTVGKPGSNGCVRNTNDHAQWIYYNCGYGTSVYVY